MRFGDALPTEILHESTTSLTQLATPNWVVQQFQQRSRQCISITREYKPDWVSIR
jgi:hypothetical protein